MKAVIVTGANGFIGTSLIKKLVEQGIKIVAVDVNFSISHLPPSDLVIKIESGVDSSLSDKIPQGEYDAFYHLAWKGVNGIEKANPTVQIANIQMAVDCANICKKLDVKKLLCAGTVAENATLSLSDLSHTTGGMMYGVAKHACRLIMADYCKNIGVGFVWMQFSNIYGVGNKTGNLVSYTLGELMTGKDATFGPGLQPYDFIYVDDLIEAIYRLGTHETKKSFYYIGSGCPRILKEFIIRIGEVSGCVERVKVGARPDDGIRYSVEMFNNNDLVDAIGEYISTPFDEGVAKTIEWINTQKP